MHNNGNMLSSSPLNILKTQTHTHTWPPEKDEFKVVFETPGVENTVSK